MPRLLIVEDQKKLLSSLQRGLEEKGYEVVTATTGEQGYYAATTEYVDAIILDLMLPGRDGIQVLRDLRSKGFTRPVLILTARDALEDKVLGLDTGADDYLVKPFAFAELLARLRALLRRDVSGRELVLRADDLEVDLLARRVVRGGVELELTKREYELLEYLLRHKNSVVTREMIARDVWKEVTGVPTNAIDVYMTLLRKKLERPGSRQLIHTLRGVGYSLREGSWAS
jgi:DNA-binding response OmpR family regulator